MYQKIKDEVGKNMPIGISMIDSNGVFLLIDDILISMIGCKISNISENVFLSNVFSSSDKDDINIIDVNNIPKLFKVKIIPVGELFHVITINISLYINEDHLLNLNRYSVDNNKLPILWVKKDGVIIYGNKSANELSDDSPVVDKYIYRMASDIKKIDWDKLWNKLKLSDDISFMYNFYSKKMDKIFALKVMCNRVTYYSCDYCQIVISDITEMMEINMDLSKQMKKVEESEKTKSMFLSNISHEIRTPMNAIIGFSEILNERVKDDLKEFTDIIIQNGDYLLSLMDNIIDISRVDSGEVRLNNRLFDVMSIFNNLYLKYNNNLTKIDKNIELVLGVSETLFIESDSYIIEQCLERLIDNSIKFTKEGIINIGYRNDNNKITFYVSDSGIGIENKYHEIIFDRFRQIHKHSMGSGLGLAVFKSYVEFIGGTYNIESNEESGSEFSFTINRYLSTTSKCNITKYNNLQGKNIIICDDIDINRILIFEMLSPYGVNVILCKDGKECIDEFMGLINISLILMDLDMPIINGYDAVSYIRKYDKEIPIIAQSAYASKKNIEQTTRLGFNDFLSKPIKKDELIKKIIKYL